MKQNELIFLIERITKKVLKEDSTDRLTIGKDDIKKVEDLINTPNYAKFVEKLGDNMKDPKVKALLRYGLKDSKPTDEKITMTRVAIPVTRLKPTQAEIDIVKSLMYPLTYPEQIETYLKGGNVAVAGMDIVTCDEGRYIVDGHHRWSQLYMINPKAKITAHDLNIDNPQEALKATQLAIATDPNLYDIPTAKGGANLYEITEDVLKKYVLEVITDEVVEVFKKYYTLKDEDLEKNKQEIANYIWKNVVRFKKYNAPMPGAPDRTIMPQTDKSKNWDSRLKQGLVNFKEPFVSTDTVTANESKKLDKLIEVAIKRILKESAMNDEKWYGDFVDLKKEYYTKYKAMGSNSRYIKAAREIAKKYKIKYQDILKYCTPSNNLSGEKTWDKNGNIK